MIRPVDFLGLLHPDRPRPNPILTYRHYNLVLRGEIVRVAGDPGVGKSFFLLEMSARAILGQSIASLQPEAQRVLWVDEEGDEDILAERLELMGIKAPDLQENLCYFLNQNIFLDRHEVRDRLFTEVAAFRPDIIVIDSTSRIHTLAENDAGEMARLYNLGLKPLSRTFGATVFLIDHTRKEGFGGDDSQQAIRGSIEKSAQIDRAWLLRKTGATGFSLSHVKTRRGGPVPPLYFKRDAQKYLSHVMDTQ